MRAGAEECDANGESAGCNDACRVQVGWTCTGGTPAKKDNCTSTCGDGVRAVAEEGCDDGNTSAGDGCSASCGVEAGFTCVQATPGAASVCENCGNGKREGSETCDDGGAAGGCNDACGGIDAGWLCSGGSSSTPDVCVGGPAAPTAAPTASLITSDSITFGWEAVVGNGLPPSYVLEYRDESSATVWVRATATTELKVKLEGLRATGSYRARVFATTTAGDSGTSPLSAVATTLAVEETVELESDSNASDELNSLVDTLVSGAATSDYLSDLGVGGFELVPPPAPPAEPLADDGSIGSVEELEALLGDLDGNATLADSIAVPVPTDDAPTTSAGTVSIGPGEFTFDKATAKVAENAGSGGALNVTVRRENGAFGAVSVAYATGDGTAVAGQHYTALSGTVSFAAGQLEAQLVLHVVDNDDFVNDPPKFTLTLRDATGGATLGTHPVLTVSILEDDQATLIGFVSTRCVSVWWCGVWRVVWWRWCGGGGVVVCGACQLTILLLWPLMVLLVVDVVVVCARALAPRQ